MLCGNPITPVEGAFGVICPNKKRVAPYSRLVDGGIIPMGARYANNELTARIYNLQHASSLVESDTGEIFRRVTLCCGVECGMSTMFRMMTPHDALVVNDLGSDTYTVELAPWCQAIN
jgi:hypothetical protein